LRYVVMAAVAALLVGYDAIYRTGYYLNAAIRIIKDWGSSQERFVESLF
jgi:hypothetical protein